MSRFITFTFFAVVMALSGCAPRIVNYDGPEVTRVMVFKEQRVMLLMHHQQPLKAYRFELGFAPVGHKQIEGDGRTPEGEYIIDRRNPNSDYHLSIGISYPNTRDIEVARGLGMSPGGDIFIHGTPRRFRRRGDDWTWGCIAVKNDEIEEIYSMVGNGTEISIFP